MAMGSVLLLLSFSVILWQFLLTTGQFESGSGSASGSGILSGTTDVANNDSELIFKVGCFLYIGLSIILVLYILNSALA